MQTNGPLWVTAKEINRDILGCGVREGGMWCGQEECPCIVPTLVSFPVGQFDQQAPSVLRNSDQWSGVQKEQRESLLLRLRKHSTAAVSGG